MGFQFKKVTDGECLIESTTEKDDGVEFLGCIQEALKSLCLKITVDITSKPSSLGMILLDLIKVQSVVKRQYGAVTIVGLSDKIPAPFLDRIRQAGILIAAPHQRKDDSSAPLPSGIQMRERLEEIKKALSDSIQRKKFLEREMGSYKERISELNKNRDLKQNNSKLNEKLVNLDFELAKLKDQRVKLQKDLIHSEKEIKPVEDESKKIISANFAEHKKQIEPLERKVADLKKQKEKIEADFKKKNEARQTQIGQLVRKNKPSDSP